MKSPESEKEIENLLFLNYVPATILLDNNLQIIRFYGSTSEFLLPASDEVAIPMKNIVRIELVDEVELLITQAKKENTPFKKQNIEFALDGIITKVDIAVMPIKGDSADPHFLVSFQSVESQKGGDIITTKLLEVEKELSEDKVLLDTNKKLNDKEIEEREEKFRALMQNAFDVITIFNYDGTITYQSDSIEKVLGFSAAERVGKNIFIDSTVFPEDREIEKTLFQKCIDIPYNIFRAEFRMVAKDGSLKIMEVSCVNLANNSNVRGIIKNYRDVTEKRLIEKQKEDFIGVASHELKTPVTSIKAYTQILHENLTSKNDLESAEILLKMENQINRLTNLINDLLDVTKINEGKLKLKKEEFDINELINQIAGDMQMTTKKHTISLDLQKASPIMGDHEKISQVLVNFLSNAIKYSPSSNQIIIKSSVTDKEVTVCVQDFGIGMSKEIHENLFKRFFRFKDESTRTFPGLGLGLYISAEIINRHQGKIWAESSPNEGSSFCFTLPI